MPRIHDSEQRLLLTLSQPCTPRVLVPSTSAWPRHTLAGCNFSGFSIPPPCTLLTMTQIFTAGIRASLSCLKGAKAPPQQHPGPGARRSAFWPQNLWTMVPAAHHTATCCREHRPRANTLQQRPLLHPAPPAAQLQGARRQAMLRPPTLRPYGAQHKTGRRSCQAQGPPPSPQPAVTTEPNCPRSMTLGALGTPVGAAS